MPVNNETLLFTVCAQDSGKRVDAFLATHLETAGVSRERVKSFIKSGGVLNSGQVVGSASSKVWEGDTIAVTIQPGHNVVKAEDGELHVVYQDTELAIINKPADLTVHTCPSCQDGTLVNRMVKYFPQLAEQDNERPGIVHRLDKDTSGIILVALTERCRLAMSKLFAGREMHKQYLALVHGVPKQHSGIIDEPIGRHPTKKILMAVTPSGKEAKTAWQVLYADPAGNFSILGVRIFSGRTHQIRVHLTHLGHPIIGDPLYTGQPREQKATGTLRRAGYVPGRQMLHAARLAFEHPFPETIPVNLPKQVSRNDANLQCFLPPPDDFMETLSVLTTSALRVVITGLPGCGKSAFLQAFAHLGVPVSSADKVVEHLYSPGQDGWRILQARFGERFFSPDVSQVSEASGKSKKYQETMVLDRGKLGEAMNADHALRREVENLIHPLVEHRHQVFFGENEQKGSFINIVEIPLYLEAGYQQRVDFGAGHPVVLLGINCPEPLRHSRLMHNRGWSKDKCVFIDSWQWPEDKKMQACDFVVENIGTEDEVLAAAKVILQKLKLLRKKQASSILSSLEGVWGKSLDDTL